MLTDPHLRSALASMTMRDGASSGGSSLKLVASLADELERSDAGPHPPPQLSDAVERGERARPVTPSRQVVAKDALSGTVHVLMVARGVLREPQGTYRAAVVSASASLP